MEISSMIKIGIVIGGIVTILAGFWFYSAKKMTADLAVVWELLGAALLLTGAIPVLSSWVTKLSAGTGVALFCVGAVLLWGGFQFSLLISRLVMKNQELAIQVSLLLEENEQIRMKLDEVSGKYEKDAAGY